jgi:hypothetical protein
MRTLKSHFFHKKKEKENYIFSASLSQKFFSVEMKAIPLNQLSSSPRGPLID